MSLRRERGQEESVCGRGRGSRPEATDVLSESQEGLEMGVPGFHRGEAQGLRVGEGVSESVRSEEDSQENEVPPRQLWNKAASPAWAAWLFLEGTMKLMKNEEKRKNGKFWV